MEFNKSVSQKVFSLIEMPFETNLLDYKQEQKKTTFKAESIKYSDYHESLNYCEAIETLSRKISEYEKVIQEIKSSCSINLELKEVEINYLRAFIMTENLKSSNEKKNPQEFDGSLHDNFLDQLKTEKRVQNSEKAISQDSHIIYSSKASSKLAKEINSSKNQYTVFGPGLKRSSKESKYHSLKVMVSKLRKETEKLFIVHKVIKDVLKKEDNCFKEQELHSMLNEKDKQVEELIDSFTTFSTLYDKKFDQINSEKEFYKSELMILGEKYKALLLEKESLRDLSNHLRCCIIKLESKLSSLNYTNTLKPIENIKKQLVQNDSNILVSRAEIKEPENYSEESLKQIEMLNQTNSEIAKEAVRSGQLEDKRNKHKRVKTNSKRSIKWSFIKN